MLSRKNFIVTGGDRGIGEAIVKRLAQGSANVALIYAHDMDRAKQTALQYMAYGVRIEIYRADVSSFMNCKEAVRQITKEFGTIHGLVNNAGITKDGLLMTMKDEDFDRVIDVNLKGAFNMIKAIAPTFIKQKYGKIVNISSISGLTGNAGQANYSASKAGLIGLTKSVAREFASRNVTCNAIAPGFIDTDMTANIDDDNPLAANIPLGHRGTPEDVAQCAAFLLDSSSDYITGEVIRVDGGLAM